MVDASQRGGVPARARWEAERGTAEGRATKAVPNTVQAASKQKQEEYTSRGSTQASKARGRAGHANTAGHASKINPNII